MEWEQWQGWQRTMRAGLAAVNRAGIGQVYQWSKKLHFGLLPPTCLLCGAAGVGPWDLCAGCRRELPWQQHVCRRCGQPLVAATDAVCGHCQQQPPACDRIVVPLRYQAPLDHLIKRLKFNRQLTYARLLGELLAEALQERREPLPEVLLPVPLHPARLRQRGFNQSLELARPVAQRLGLPLWPDAIRRVRHTRPQVGLAASARLANVRDAFQLARPLPVQRVAILDDVITTGSTVNEIARVLKAGGVGWVEVWACARTVSGTARAIAY
jgi:ComF family protein